eukprot:7375899-Pyramimonas_sp.AAC.2
MPYSSKGIPRNANHRPRPNWFRHIRYASQLKGNTSMEIIDLDQTGSGTIGMSRSSKRIPRNANHRPGPNWFKHIPQCPRKSFLRSGVQRGSTVRIDACPLSGLGLDTSTVELTFLRPH